METGNDPDHRYRWKLYLIKRLYRMGYGRQDVVLLFEFIDWIMLLPKNIEQGLWKEIEAIEKEKKMEYITSVERIGIEKGLRKGSANLLGRLMSLKFRVERETLAPIFAGLTTDQVEELGEFFMEAQSLEEIRERADKMRKAES